MQRLSGHTQPFAVLGHPIGHTLSPVMHNASMQAMGMDAIYLALDVKPDNLMMVLPAMQALGFRGVNLTIPHKEVAFRGLEQLDESAMLVGAVNTVAFTEKGMVGHNTDGYGFLRAVEEAFGTGVAGKKLFVLGCGGAGRAVALVSARQGGRDIVLADLDRERCEKVAAEVKAAGAASVRIADTPASQVEACRDSELIVQATPVGMKPDDQPLLPSSAFCPGQWAFDLIYMTPETVFTREAAKGGATTASGLGMLLHQGARAFTIWTGREPRIDSMRAALEAAVYGAG